VAEASEGLCHPGRDPVLELQNARAEAVVAEAFMVVERVEARRFDRLLGAHAEDGEVEQDLERLLILAVAPRAREGEKRLAVAEDDRRGQGGAWPLTARHDVRMPLPEDEGLHPVAEWHPGVAGDEDAAEKPRRGWRGREEVPSRVGDVDRRGVG
jgi:hypothetical protein